MAAPRDGGEGVTTVETPIGAATACRCGVAVSAEGDTPRQRIAAMAMHVRSLGHAVWAWRAGVAEPQAIAIPVIDPLEWARR